MGFFATLVKGGGGTTKKTTTPVKVPSVATVTGVAAAIVKGATIAATNLSKSYQKPKSNSNNNKSGGNPMERSRRPELLREAEQDSRDEGNHHYREPGNRG